MPSLPNTLDRRLTAGLIASAFVALACLLVASRAAAADSVYWANEGDRGGVLGIGHAALDGSGGGALALAGASQTFEDIAIDPVGERIYWSSWGEDTVESAPLGGGPATRLDLSGVEVKYPEGIAIDPPANKIYIANSGEEPEVGASIIVANLDGSGDAHALPIPESMLESPWGLVIDTAAGKIYWSDQSLETIDSANLDGSGATELNTSGAPVNDPEGLAIDPVTQRVYWTNERESSIGWAALNGSGGGGLDTTGAPLSAPNGVAIDPDSRMLYVASYHLSEEDNTQGTISRVSLGGGGSQLAINGTTPVEPAQMALLKAPAGATPPTLSGSPRSGAVLSCGGSTWQGNLPQSELYRAPHSVAYGWTLNGAPLAAGPTVKVGAAGAYACTATATNAAGSTTVASAPLTVTATKLRAKPKKGKLSVAVGKAATFAVGISNSGDISSAAGKACLKAPKKTRKALKLPKCAKLPPLAPGRSKTVKLTVKAKAGAAPGTYKLKLTLPSLKPLHLKLTVKPGKGGAHAR